MATEIPPFEQLNNALKTLFENYDELERSLESLSKYVFNIPRDARDQAVQISKIRRETRYNLVLYLKSLEEMSNAIVDTDFERCESQAITARYTMNARLEPQVGVENADEMLKALENVAETLRDQDKNKPQSDANIDKEIQKATNGANSIIKDVTLRLLRYIKEEIRKAVDDSSIFINPSKLVEEVEKVKETIAETKKSYSENISALNNIISMTNELLGKENTEETLIALKSNAESLKDTCQEKLSSIQA